MWQMSLNLAQLLRMARLPRYLEKSRILKVTLPRGTKCRFLLRIVLALTQAKGGVSFVFLLPTASMSEQPEAWWKAAVVYQIYPISFFDSNGDGIGDLPGIRAKLDYLKDLGVDVLWISPVYSSPWRDMGYDVADYCDIDRRFGTLADWDALVEDVHARGMKIMIDIVLNHSSDEHPWFIESKSSKINNRKRDWYIWRSPKYDANGMRCPPNNWKSVFGGSAWEYDPATQEYYLHLFLKEQPDLNWENPAVREAAADAMRFWIARGCNGFRMDVINLLAKAEGLPDAPVTTPGEIFQEASALFANQPKVHEYIKELHHKVFSQHDLIVLGETGWLDHAEEVLKYVLPKCKELNMVFQFELAYMDSPKGGAREVSVFAHRPWRLSELKALVTKYQTLERDAGFWNAVFLETHDQARSVSRFGDDTDAWRLISAKLLALFAITQSGTQYIFQGQELGLKNFPAEWGLHEYKDDVAYKYYARVLAQRAGNASGADVDMSDVLDGLQKKARDHARVPMQWDPTPNGGFTTGTPWMRVNDDYLTWNAAGQVDNPHSVYAFWKRTLRLRQEHKVLIYGDFEAIDPDNEEIFAYTRSYGTERVLVVLNFTASRATFTMASTPGHDFRLIIGNYPEREAGWDSGFLELEPYEGMVYSYPLDTSTVT
ncbi:glycoside hydrolase family 13 protein [Mycena galericulata]|nr:glycoside hydrolase family 13 protein [Mycena galericulata]